MKIPSMEGEISSMDGEMSSMDGEVSSMAEEMSSMDGEMSSMDESVIRGCHPWMTLPSLDVIHGWHLWMGMMDDGHGRSICLLSLDALKNLLVVY